jgi:uncharacterized coiled-coil protein SlyX
MTIDRGSEARRHDLYTWAQGAMGPENAQTLMELLPPLGWADVARRADVDALHRDVERDLASSRSAMDVRLEAMQQRIARMEERIAGMEERIAARLDQQVAQLRVEMHRALRVQLLAIMGMVGTLWIGGLGIVAGMR